MRNGRPLRVRSLVCVTYALLFGVGAWSAGAQVEDPMRPPEPALSGGGPGNAGSPEPSGGAWVLTSTMIWPRHRTAVINGQEVSLGERVADAVVIDIKPYAVRLKRGNEVFAIPLLPEDSVKITGAFRKAIQDDRLRGQGELREW